MEKTTTSQVALQERLKQLYIEKLLPLEKYSNYEHFYSPSISAAEFEAKPHVFLIGQYSTGKTTFINYLLGRDYFGCNVGPEPTTDRFIAIIEGEDGRTIPGGALSIHPNLPYQGLEKFGVSFLNKFEGVQSPSPILHNISFIDSPGILSGEKQSISRGYNFVEICSWFADKSDLIIMLFDADKLDISDELRNVMVGMMQNREKIRFVLNKADQLDKQNLLRVHGALLWSLGKIITSPEVPRVYVGSFWKMKKPHCENLDLFQREERDLLKELFHLPVDNLIRKINLISQRCRQVRVHALIVSYLREHCSTWFRVETHKHEMIEHLQQIFHEILRQHPDLITLADFPQIPVFQQQLTQMDWSTFHQLRHHDILLDKANELLTTDLSYLIHEVRYNLPNTLASHLENEPLLRKESSTTGPVTNTGTDTVVTITPPPPALDMPPHPNSSITSTPGTGVKRGKYHGIMRPGIDSNVDPSVK